jgi:hypothetical protein
VVLLERPGRFESAVIDAVAALLDRKREALAAALE